jgi:hypothetical protein
MRRTLMVGVAGLMFVACKDNTAPDVEPGIGSFLLVTIGGQVLPRDVVTGNATRVRVFGSSLTILKGERQVEDFLDYQFLDSAGQLRLRASGTRAMSRQLTGARATITLSSNADVNLLRPVSGWAEGDSLILESASEARWVYRRIR